MKASGALALALSTAALASPLYRAADGVSQIPLGSSDLESALAAHLNTVPAGFDINLDAKRLIKLSRDAEPVWMTEREKIMAKANGVKFIDVTDTHENFNAFTVAQEPQEYGIYNVTGKVKSVIKTLSTDGPKKNLEKFTSFRTRYYRSETGRQSQLWLLEKVNEIVTSTASKELQSRISVAEFEHSWNQNSIILKLKGSSNKNNGSVIISAHQDSTNMFPFLPAPGADDDGSGTVTILEALRGLLAADFSPVHDVEFHWYSAEEGGLLGSQAVVKDYAAKKAKVKAQLQFDMTAWVQKGTTEEVGIITDFVDLKLTDFIKTLIDKYLRIGYVETKCGYACSDHASWTEAGYPGAFGIESSFEKSNKNIHSMNDKLDVSPEFNFDHLLEFSKLAVSYLIEVAGWE